MSSEIAIRAENIGKRYRIGATQGIGRYRSLREEIAGLASRKRSWSGGGDRDLWALKDVSFEIRAGETVGIIGRNGAGKSTLLKILARITPPTSGRGEIFGRVGSLLEVGTGFHPELSGRENIMLAAAIIGMRRHEVLARFDQIVEFADLAKFLETPVKRYSSGMYMRLAFSVAAHLEPEILLVDEVLAVGDAAFQRKCLGRMEELGGAGRTVLFVSHSMASILRLCPRAILFNYGRLVSDDRAHATIRAYFDSGLGSSAQRIWESRDSSPGDSQVRLRAVRVLDPGGKPTHEVDLEQVVKVEVEYEQLSGDPGLKPNVILMFYNSEGVCLFASFDWNNEAWAKTPREPGLVRSTCTIPANFLAEGRVTLTVFVTSFAPFVRHVTEPDVVAFQAVDRMTGRGVRGEYASDMAGVVRPMLDWAIQRGEERW